MQGAQQLVMPLAVGPLWQLEDGAELGPQFPGGIRKTANICPSLRRIDRRSRAEAVGQQGVGQGEAVLHKTSATSAASSSLKPPPPPLLAHQISTHWSASASWRLRSACSSWARLSPSCLACCRACSAAKQAGLAEPAQHAERCAARGQWQQAAGQAERTVLTATTIY